MILSIIDSGLAGAVDNPCFGCISPSCISCACAGERQDIAEQMQRLKVFAAAPETKAEKESQAEKKKQPVKECEVRSTKKLTLRSSLSVTA